MAENGVARGRSTRQGLWGRVAGRTDAFLRWTAAYFISLTSLVVTLGPLWSGFDNIGVRSQWAKLAIASTPLVVVSVVLVLEVFRKRLRLIRLRAYALSVEERRRDPGFFRLGPYVNSAEDQARFNRADRAHLQVMEWFRKSQAPVLFLTGDSGSGKSSLLNASLVPGLSKGSPPYFPLILRCFEDPARAMRDTLLKPKTIWETPPKEVHGLRELVRRACSRLKTTQLVVVLDQFEEYLILRKETQAEPSEVEGLMASLEKDPIEGLVFLVVIRSDYLERLTDTALPPPDLGRNRFELRPFTKSASVDFLARAHLGIDAERLEQYALEASRVDNLLHGEIRPITLNMLGTILTRTKLATENSRLGQGAVRGLFREYLGNCIDRPDLRGLARPVLSAMLSLERTKWPRTVDELADATGFDRTTVSACLCRLHAMAVIRPIDRACQLWEISHDFVAGQLAVLLDPRIDRSRKWARVAALVCLCLFPGLALSLAPQAHWYDKVEPSSVNRPRDDGQSWLHYAVTYDLKRERVPAVRCFLALGADINARRKEDGRTPLHVAVGVGDADVVGALAGHTHPPDFIAADFQGNTPLHVCAIAQDRGRIAEILARAGRGAIGLRNQRGWTPLHEAAAAGNVGVVKALLDAGADAEEVSTRPKQRTDNFLYPSPLWTPLQLAVKGGHLPVVRALLDSSKGPAIVNAQTTTCGLPLYLAASLLDDGNTTAIVTALLDRGARAEAVSNREEIWGPAGQHYPQTPLLQAAALGNLGVVRTILKHLPGLISKPDAVGWTALHWAAAGGRPAVVAELITLGANPTVTSQNGQTPLHVICMGPNRQEVSSAEVNSIVEMLLDAPTAGNTDLVNAPDAAKSTPLILAAGRCHLALVKSLLARHARVDVSSGLFGTAIHAGLGFNLPIPSPPLVSANEIGVSPGLKPFLPGDGDRVQLVHALIGGDGGKKALEISRSDTGQTPILQAAAGGRVDLFRVLLEGGADVEARDPELRTALHLAILENRKEVVALMLKVCPPDRLDLRATDRQGNMPLHHAAWLDWSGEIVAMLIDHLNPEDLTMQGELGRTPLHWAAIKNNARVAEAILAKTPPEVAMVLRDGGGYMPLHWAAQLGNVGVITSLLKSSPDVLRRGENGSTPLHYAAQRGQVDAVQAILAHDRRPEVLDARDLEGDSPLHLAAMNSQIGTLKVLLEAGARPDLRGSLGRTPLHWSVNNGWYDGADLLMAHPSATAVTEPDDSGASALHLVTRRGDKTFIEMMVARQPQADLNVRLSEGKTSLRRTPLHLAAELGWVHVARYLSEQGADPALMDEAGETPLQVAERTGHHAVAAVLKHALSAEVQASKPGTGDPSSRR